MSWTKGVWARKGIKATEDAYVMRRMKESGAILLGVTNIPEFCLWVESRNFVYGQTNNPYDTNRTVGGSSGGEVSDYLLHENVTERFFFFRAILTTKRTNSFSRDVSQRAAVPHSV